MTEITILNHYWCMHCGYQYTRVKCTKITWHDKFEILKPEIFENVNFFSNNYYHSHSRSPPVEKGTLTKGEDGAFSNYSYYSSASHQGTSTQESPLVSKSRHRGFLPRQKTSQKFRRAYGARVAIIYR